MNTNFIHVLPKYRVPATAAENPYAALDTGERAATRVELAKLAAQGNLFEIWRWGLEGKIPWGFKKEEPECPMLFYACLANQREPVERVLALGVNKDCLCPYPLPLAICRFDAPVALQALIDAGCRFHAKTRTENALTEATKANQPRMMTVLLENGVDPDAAPLFWTSAYVAADHYYLPRHKKLRLLRLLSKHGANLNRSGDTTHGQSLPLTVAIKEDDVWLMRGLLALGASEVYDKTAEHETSPFQFAVNCKSSRCIAHFLRDVTGPGEMLMGALQEVRNRERPATRNEIQAEVLISVIKHVYADEDAPPVANEADKELLRIANEAAQSSEAVDLSTLAPCDQELLPGFGITKLMFAAWRGDGEEIEQLLIKGNADRRLADIFGNTAADYARKHRGAELAAALEVETGERVPATAKTLKSLRHQEGPRAKYKEGWVSPEPVLEGFIEANDKERLAQDLAASPRSKEQMGQLLHKCIEPCSWACMNLLIELGGDLEAISRNYSGMTVFAHLVSECHNAPLIPDAAWREMVSLVVARGANLEARDRDGNSVVDHSLCCGSPVVLEFLLSLGLGIKKTAKDGVLAKMVREMGFGLKDRFSWAASVRKLELALLDGVDPNCLGCDYGTHGETALAFAVANDIGTRLVHSLLAYGADDDIRTRMLTEKEHDKYVQETDDYQASHHPKPERTLLQLALAVGNQETIKLLRGPRPQPLPLLRIPSIVVESPWAL